MSARVGRPLEWTDEKITVYLTEEFLKTRKIGLNGNGSVYAVLSRRVKRGEFVSVKEAIERLWFRGLTAGGKEFLINRAAEWVVDTTNHGTASSVKRLNRLIESEKEGIALVLKEIFRPCYPVAQGMVKDFAASRRGKKLRIFISAVGLNQVKN